MVKNLFSVSKTMGPSILWLGLVGHQMLLESRSLQQLVVLDCICTYLYNDNNSTWDVLAVNIESV